MTLGPLTPWAGAAAHVAAAHQVPVVASELHPLTLGDSGTVAGLATEVTVCSQHSADALTGATFSGSARPAVTVTGTPALSGGRPDDREPRRALLLVDQTANQADRGEGLQQTAWGLRAGGWDVHVRVGVHEQNAPWVRFRRDRPTSLVDAAARAALVVGYLTPALLPGAALAPTLALDGGHAPEPVVTALEHLGATILAGGDLTTVAAAAHATQSRTVPAGTIDVVCGPVGGAQRLTQRWRHTARR